MYFLGQIVWEGTSLILALGSRITLSVHRLENHRQGTGSVPRQHYTKELGLDDKLSSSMKQNLQK